MSARRFHLDEATGSEERALNLIKKGGFPN